MLTFAHSRNTHEINVMTAIAVMLAAILLFPLPARALTFEFPVRCEIGKECFIQKYVDHDQSKDWHDYRCGRLSNDGHKGTDIRVPTMQEMNPGVDILAAADGTVLAIRDEMEDISVHKADPATLHSRECGNGVVIDHGEGWVTQYCHMRKGSIAVKQADAVTVGHVLGQMGLSGSTEYPHLHFEMRKDAKTIDPFTGHSMQTACGQSGAPLWTAETLKELDYQATGILTSGFSSTVPTKDDVREGRKRRDHLPATASKIVFWVQMFGVGPDQELTVRLLSPKGKTLAEDIQRIESHNAEYFRYIGVRRKGHAWPAGEYKGAVKLIDTRYGRNETLLEFSAPLKVE